LRCNSHRHGIAIYVINRVAARHAGDYRKVSGFSQKVEQGGVGTDDPADEAEAGVELFRVREARVDAGEADSPRAQRRDQLW
jgi:hypothetical protein